MTLAWIVEWKIALRRRRLLGFNVVIPLILILPLITSGAPVPHAAAATAVFFVIFGVFGSSIPLVRDGQSGLIRRWMLSGADPRGFLVGRLLAQSTLDVAVLVPTLALLLWWPGQSSAGGVSLLSALVVTLLVANALGSWIAALARSLAEAALLGAVVTLLLLHAGGVFRSPPPGTAQARIESGTPFHLLHDALLEAFGGAGNPPGASLGALAAAALFLVTTAAVGPLLMDRLSRLESE